MFDEIIRDLIQNRSSVEVEGNVFKSFKTKSEELFVREETIDEVFFPIS